MDAEAEAIIALWTDLRLEMVRITEATQDLYAWLAAQEAKAGGRALGRDG